MRRPPRIASLAVCLLSVLLACSPSYTEEGRSLGEQHRRMVEQKELTEERLVRDLERAIADLDEAAQEEFAAGYREAIEPVERQIGDLLAGAQARELERLVGGMLRRMLGEFQDMTDRAVDEAAEALEEMDPAKMREAGRNVGRSLNRMVEGMDAFMEGVREGVEGRAEEDR